MKCERHDYRGPTTVDNGHDVGVTGLTVVGKQPRGYEADMLAMCVRGVK